MSINGQDDRQRDVIALQLTGNKVSIPSLLISAAVRLARRTFAALIGLVATGSIGFALSKALRFLDWSSAVAIFTSSIAGFALLLCVTALSVMRHRELDHVGYLCAIGTAITVLCGAPIGLAAALLLSAGPAEHMLGHTEYWSADWFVYVLAPLCSATIAAALPSLILAWARVARYQSRLWQTIQFVWDSAKERPYNWLGLNIGICLTCGLLACVPIVGLLIPVFLAQCFALLTELTVKESEGRK